MKYFTLILCLLISMSASAEERIKKIPVPQSEAEENVTNLHEESPEEIAIIERSGNHRVQYMLDNYTLAEMAQYAIEYNKAQIAAAKNGETTPPQRLTKEILQDKEKIAEYLRSQFQIRD